MIFFKDCSRRNLRSISSSRLQKLNNKSPTLSRKFLYIGDEPRKIERIVQRSSTPERCETPFVNYIRPEGKARPVSGIQSRKRLESQNKSSFKRKVFKASFLGHRRQRRRRRHRRGRHRHRDPASRSRLPPEANLMIPDDPD